jgi:uncharacterized membrane protein
MPRTDVAHPSTVAIAGHPIHPALVPLPIGAAVLAFASDLAAARTGDAFWARCSRWLLRASLVTGAAAAPLGSVDLLTIPAARRLPSAWVHAAGNSLVLLLTLLEVARRRGGVRAAEAAPDRTGFALALLGISGWLGGELSYRHRIGVMRAEATGQRATEATSAEEDRPGGPVGAAFPVVEDAGGGGLGWVGGAVPTADRTGPAGVEEGVMPSEERADREREARVPRDGATPGSVVSADAGGPGGQVAAGIPETAGVATTTSGLGAALVDSGDAPVSDPDRGVALDPDTADAIARELARGEEPKEGRADVLDEDPRSERGRDR